MITKLIIYGTLIILSLTLSISMIIYVIKTYKSSSNDLEKTIYLFLLAAIFVPIILFICDVYNVPSLLKYTKNINPDSWLNFLGTYSASIFSTLISSAFLIFVTYKQIRRTYEDNIELNKENYRIQNMPYMQYDFNKEIEDIDDISKLKLLISNHNNKYDSVVFSMEIKNIGLNAIRKTYFVIDSTIFKEKEIFELGSQSSIDKDEIKKQDFMISNLSDGEYIINFTIYYQDLLKNWYEQKVILYLSVINYYKPTRIVNKKIKIYDEIQLKNKPKILNKLDD